ncbi:hypothetical protein [Ruegeria sp. THAF33]|uniref:hypothetical protein n=1 Tax=Ruegeria sp. THAF33 TaxID=2587853 RepID=UPI00352B27C8
MVGYISNGCIDRDIRLQVVSVLETGGTAKKGSDTLKALLSLLSSSHAGRLCSCL